MSWYATGTVAVTNNSAAVVGTGTQWIANVEAGDIFWGPEGRGYEIVSVNSNTSLTIGPAYAGATAGAQAYRIAPTQGRVVPLTASVNQLLTDFGGIRDGIGSGNFPDGTAAAPALRFGADTDTGLYRIGANTLGIAAGGVLRFFIDATQAASANPLSIPDGSGALPSLRFTSDLDTGIYKVGANILGFAAGGAGIARIDTGGLRLFSTVGLAGEALTIFSQSDGAPAFVSRFDAGTNKPYFLLRHVDGSSLTRLDANSSSGVAQLSLAIKNVDALVVTNSRHIEAGTDNNQTLGGAAKRWSVVYAGTGTINTSDGREKSAKRALPAAELAAAKRIAGTIGIFQFLDAIAEKGEEGARLHVGVIAQDVWAIMADEGLIDPIAEGVRPDSHYAFLCYDEWDAVAAVEEVCDEEGNVVTPAQAAQPSGNRFGVRPDQLALFLIAAQEARLAALEGSV
jgi:hypothetical protein